MGGLTLLLVPIWFSVAWLLFFLLAMAGAGAAAPSFFDSFDLRHIGIIVLAFPLGGLALGWRGIARASRWVVLSGVSLLAAWLLFLSGFYLHARIFASPVPGSWADRDFKIPESMRTAYHMTRFGHVLSLQFSSPKMLFAGITSTARFPRRALIEVQMQAFPPLAEKAGSACGDWLHEMVYLWRTASEGDGNLVGNFFGADASRTSALYLSADGHALARCDTEGYCVFLFRNDGFLSEFDVQRDDLCHAPEINRRLIQLTADWVR